jgi:thioredoxin 1
VPYSASGFTRAVRSGARQATGTRPGSGAAGPPVRLAGAPGPPPATTSIQSLDQPIHTARNVTMSIVHVNDQSFETQVLKSSRPVLVDFWAEWCGPCKMIAPILDQIALEYQDRLEIAKVDVEDSQGTAMKYGIRSIPTLMLFKDGVVQAQHVGMLSKEQLSKLLDAKLQGA